MAGLCEGSNEPPGSLKASNSGYTKTLIIVSKRIQVSSFDLDQFQKWMLERYEFNEENVSALKFLHLSVDREVTYGQEQKQKKSKSSVLVKRRLVQICILY
ncbi:hypothetical protein ANN_26637 [Periplaneta americana]|uniref:Uncharacterized protein n=1 Tax=Periplaneta americana TaxID=6978 RepID=A0ABQ8RYM0_PERAM|nr:hypothetical protein ANN_26637 [Periplaneta americana]